MAEPTNSRPNRSNRGIQLSRIIDSLDKSIPLPQDLRSFLVYSAVLCAIAAGMIVHVFLSAQILQREVELADIQEQHMVVERQNGELLWRIGRATNFEHIQDEARAEGYLPIAERQFVKVDLDGIANTPSSATGAEQATPAQNAATTGEDEITSQPLSDSEQAVMPDDTVETIPAGQPEMEGDSQSADRITTWRQWRGVVFPQETDGDTADGSSTQDIGAGSPDAATNADLKATEEAQTPDEAPTAEPGGSIPSLWRHYFRESAEDLFTQPANEQTGQ